MSNTQFDQLIDLKRYLLRCGVELSRLPPFAVSPEQTVELKQDERVFRENCRSLAAASMNAMEVFTVHGLRCVRSDYLTGVTRTPMPAEPINVRDKYDELIYEVATKHPGETRHETARRYIHERENRPCAEGVDSAGS